MAATVFRKALIVDFYSHSTLLNDHQNSNTEIANSIVSIITKLKGPGDLIHVYLLTSIDDGSNDASSRAEVAANGYCCGAAEMKAVSGERRLDGFYAAKAMLDELDITSVTVLCHADWTSFWVRALELLLTPLYDRAVEAAQTTTVLVQLNVKTGTAGRPEVPQDPPVDKVQVEVLRLLASLPSVLGVPEVEVSPVLPGRAEGFVHGYSTRRGGVTLLPSLCAMNLHYTQRKRDPRAVVEENLRRLAQVGGFNPDNYHTIRVEHGHRVWVVGDDRPDCYDALVTDRCDITLAAPGADCLPLLFADPVRRIIGAAHAGWKGTVERIAREVVRTMSERFGSRPEDIRVAMGPGVRPGCFTVLTEEGQLFSAIHPSCVLGTEHKPLGHRVVEHQGTASKSRTRNGERGQQPVTKGGYPQPLHDGLDCACSDLGKGRAGVEESSLATKDAEHLKRDGLAEGDIKTTSGLVSCSGDPAWVDGTDVYETVHHRDALAATEKPLQQAVAQLKRLPQPQFPVVHVPVERLLRKSRPPALDPSLQRVHVDLQVANHHVLLQAGVLGRHIDHSTSHCTRCNPELYFSNERDGFPFGNQIGFICMPLALQH